jgi:S1-C subfamily serine protease
MKTRRLAVGIVWLVAVLPIYAKDKLSASVVKIYTTQRYPDFVRPWAKLTPTENAGSGVVIAGKRILTNVHVVQYASQIFVKADDSSDKLVATVVGTAPDFDLALLRLEDESFFENRRPIPLAKDIPHVKDKVTVYGYPTGGDHLSVTEGIISRIEYAPFYYQGAGLRIQVDAAINPGNSGGPAVANGQIVGLVFSKVTQADNIGYLISAEEINALLPRIASGKYRGQPKMLDQLQSVENDALRARLKLPKDVGGMMVTRPGSSSPTYPLRRWDVITKIGDYAIDKQGNIHVRDDLWLSFMYQVPRAAVKGKVGLTIYRDGKSLPIDLPVNTESQLVIPNLQGKYPRYFLYGPIVFSTPSQEFISRLGDRILRELAFAESPLLARLLDDRSSECEELVMLGYQLLPHPVTKGYGSSGFGIVTSVNNVRVKGLKHLVEILRDSKDEYLTFEIAGRYATLVFRRSELAKATEDILSSEGIRNECSEDLREVWRGAK